MIGIIILNYIEYTETIKCIKSIKDTYNKEYKIYIIDNNSPNDSYKILTEKYIDDLRIKVISNPLNSGYSAGNNVGIKMALDDGCEFLLISNSDIIYHEFAIEELKKNLSLNLSNWGIVGPQVLNIDGQIDIKSRMFMKTGIKEKLFARTKLRKLNFMNIYRKYYGLDKSFYLNQKVYALSGCCFMLSREIANLITPFDENTFLYEEEVIIGIQAEKTGYETYYVPSAVVTHYHAASSKHIGAFSLIHLVNSEIYYCKEYLKLNIFQILPIYFIRVLLYLSYCLKDINYRKNFLTFVKASQKRLWSRNGL